MIALTFLLRDGSACAALAGCECSCASSKLAPVTGLYGIFAGGPMPLQLHWAGRPTLIGAELHEYGMSMTVPAA